jgi:hypothetical protein
MGTKSSQKVATSCGRPRNDQRAGAVEREPAYLAYQVDPSHPGKVSGPIGVGWKNARSAVYVAFDMPVSGDVVLRPMRPGPSWRDTGDHPDYEVLKARRDGKSTKAPVVGSAWDQNRRSIYMKLAKRQTAVFLRRFRPLEKVIEI